MNEPLRDAAVKLAWKLLVVAEDPGVFLDRERRTMLEATILILDEVLTEITTPRESTRSEAGNVIYMPSKAGAR